MLATLSRQPWHIYATLGVLVGAGSICLGFTGQSLFLPSWFVRRRGLALSIAFSGVGVGSIVLLPWLQTIIEGAGWRAACWTLGILVLGCWRRSTSCCGAGRRSSACSRTATARQPSSDALAGRGNIVDHAWVATDWTLAAPSARAILVARGGLFRRAVHLVRGPGASDEISGGDRLQLAWRPGRSAPGLVGIPGQITLGQLSDRMGRELVWAVGCLDSPYLWGLLLLPDRPSRPLLYVMVLAQGLAGLWHHPGLGAIPSELFEGRHYGAIFGT